MTSPDTPTPSQVEATRDSGDPAYFAKVADLLSASKPDRQGFITMWPSSRDELVADLRAVACRLSTPSYAAGLEADLFQAIHDAMADERNGKPDGDIIVKGCEAAGYLDPESAADLFKAAAVAAIRNIPLPAESASTGVAEGVLEALEEALKQHSEPMSMLNEHELGERLASDVYEIVRHARARSAMLAASPVPPSVPEEVERLREALKPFAAVADEYHESEDDSFEVWMDAGPQRIIKASFRLEHYRRARAALTTPSSPANADGEA